MDTQFLVGLGVAIFGIGLATVGRLLKMRASMKQTLGGVGIALMIVGVGIVAYGFMPRSGIQDAKVPTSITQTNTNSPGGINALGDVTVNPEVNPDASLERYFLNGEKWVTNPSVPVGGNLIEDTPQKQAFQLIAKLQEEKNWPELKRVCEEEMKKTPGWLTPSLCAGIAYANLGEIDKAIERLDYVNKKASGNEQYSDAVRIREEIRQKFGK